MFQPQVDKKLPKQKRMLCFDLTRWLISLRVGSLLKRWPSAYSISVIGSTFTWWVCLNCCRKVSILDWRFLVSNDTSFEWGQYALRTIPLSASHTERVVFGDQPVFSGFASVCANAQTVSRQEIAKPDKYVALRPDSLTYLFTCGILIQILAVWILYFCNRN